MPYTVKLGGIPVQCDTPEEAMELVKLEAGVGNSGPTEKKTAKPSNSSESPVAGSRWTEQRVNELFRTVNANQKKFLDALLENPDGRTEDQILQILGMRNGMALAGVTTGLYKNAKKVGGDPRDLYDRKQITIGDGVTNDYVIRESFRRAAKNRHQD